ncbi:hypothetical protein EDD16DRAFT_1890822 [Pisolithus croceorrhizus]|nr:hypothetical protein EV401DRAFT_211828 [Pisolithus croceorrhizus]KAI6133228.1 hypothetical protein EDD16DRAFT_1890822 [Pisolithus croceorrhizus]
MENSESDKRRGPVGSDKAAAADVDYPQPISSPDRKRKAERALDVEHTMKPASERFSDSHLRPGASRTGEFQRQRPSQSVQHLRRPAPGMDVHRSRRPNISNVPPHHPRSGLSSNSFASQRNMLQHAWHTVHDSDPLVDSDEECPDVHTRVDYSKRILVISRLRGKSPTPEISSLPENQPDKRRDTAHCL